MDKASLLAAAFPDADPDSTTAFYSEMGDIYQALAFSDLFWPPCHEIMGAVFLGVGANSTERISQGLQELLAGSTDSRPPWSEMVDRFNWFEVPYLFGQLRDPMSMIDEAALLLADLLQQTWSARLAQLYPNRTFDVAVSNDGPEGLKIAMTQTDPPLKPSLSSVPRS